MVFDTILCILILWVSLFLPPSYVGVHPASVGPAKDFHKEVISPGSSKKVGGVRWDMVAIGAGVIVLLILVLGLSGVITYMYRHSHKDKQRR